MESSPDGDHLADRRLPELEGEGIRSVGERLVGILVHLAEEGIDAHRGGGPGERWCEGPISAGPVALPVSSSVPCRSSTSMVIVSETTVVETDVTITSSPPGLIVGDGCCWDGRERRPAPR